MFQAISVNILGQFLYENLSAVEVLKYLLTIKTWGKKFKKCSAKIEDVIQWRLKIHLFIFIENLMSDFISVISLQSIPECKDCQSYFVVFSDTPSEMLIHQKNPLRPHKDLYKVYIFDYFTMQDFFGENFNERVNGQKHKWLLGFLEIDQVYGCLQPVPQPFKKNKNQGLSHYKREKYSID